MSSMRLFLFCVICVGLPSVAAEAPGTVTAKIAEAGEQADQWHGFTRRKLMCDRREARIVEPKTALPGNPWSWCMEFPDPPN